MPETIATKLPTTQENGVVFLREHQGRTVITTNQGPLKDTILEALNWSGIPKPPEQTVNVVNGNGVLDRVQVEPPFSPEQTKDFGRYMVMLSALDLNGQQPLIVYKHTSADTKPTEIAKWPPDDASPEEKRTKMISVSLPPTLQVAYRADHSRYNGYYSFAQLEVTPESNEENPFEQLNMPYEEAILQGLKILLRNGKLKPDWPNDEEFMKTTNITDPSYNESVGTTSMHISQKTMRLLRLLSEMPTLPPEKSDTEVTEEADKKPIGGYGSLVGPLIRAALHAYYLSRGFRINPDNTIKND